mmetsp:Transcript_13976/g.30880  ORF Transcript_13976/g.30880 Transcript_13976/m.30880 type:complete len:257 (-) Transcript_13976:1170-1940(-)
MSTLLDRASSIALKPEATLNATILAFAAAAIATSDEVTSPTLEYTMSALHTASSSDSCRASMALLMACTDPSTSPLMTMGILMTSRVSAPPPANPEAMAMMALLEAEPTAILLRRCLASATSFASASLVAILSWSPAPGTPFMPTICTGVEGPTDCTWMPWSFTRRRTLPHDGPASTRSPTESVPFCTSAVTTTPSPLSTRASMTEPAAGASTTAFRFSTSDCSRIFSSSSSMPEPVLAEISTHWHSPPNSSSSTS